MAAGAEEFEVADVVAAAVAEWDAMVDVEASGGAAADADAVTLVDACAPPTPHGGVQLRRISRRAPSV